MHNIQVNIKMKKLIRNILSKIRKFDSSSSEEPRSSKLYAVTGLYNTPDEIIHAASEVASKGYKKFDVFTPYPVHGMDDAMKLKESRVGWVSFALGISGTGLAILMIWWMNGVDYKNIIGGKPFFALPPAIPITFEVTVLLAAIATVFGMLILFNKLPWINNPLQDTPFMKRVTSDKFGIAIEADDEKFSEKEIRALFSSTGAVQIEDVFFYKSNLYEKTPIFDKKFNAAVIVTAIVTAIVSYFTLNFILYDIQPFDWMWKQARIDAQASSEFFANDAGMRPPVEGTVPRNWLPYEYKGQPDSLVKFLANPLAVNMEVLKNGQTKYNTYCSVCHGYYGDGDSRLRGQFPNPPSMHTDRLRNLRDGNIYHIITNGQNVMPSYAEQIASDDRWAIIHYLRVLQRAKDAKDSDLPQ
jgi:mono/diheme cytochrome c family protein